MRTLGKGAKTRGSRVVGGGLFDVLSGKTTLDFGKLMEKGSADMRRLQTGKGLDDDLRRAIVGDNDAEKAEKAKLYAERKSRIENSDNDFRALIARSGMNGYVGNGIFGDLFEDAVVEGGKKLYQFDKSHGSHLKEGVKSGFKNMFLNTLKGGNGIESVLRYGRGKGGSMKGKHIMPDGRIMKDSEHMGMGFFTDVMPEYDPNDVSGWVEKERRDTGYYGRPAILGEGM